STETVDPQFIRRITVAPDAGDEGHDAVETTDKHVIRGRLLDTSFTVKVGNETRKLDRTEIRDIRIVREDESSLLAIVLGLITLARWEIVPASATIRSRAIGAGRLPEDRPPAARKSGLAAALGTRLLLLGTLWLILGLTNPIFTLPDLPLLHDLEAREVSWRD